MSERLNLCGACWRISHPNGWWAYELLEGVPEDTDDDPPPYYRCHSCGYDHRDTDDDPGVWQGTEEELERIRLDEQPEFRRVREALATLRKEIHALYETDVLDLDTHLPMDVRDELLTLGSSTSDFTFHIYRRRQRDDLSADPKTWMYRALEIESGVGEWGVTAREALDNYFRDDVLDHRAAPPRAQEGDADG